MLQIVGEDTLLRQTVKRIAGFVPSENIWIVTTEDKVQSMKFHLDPLGALVRSIQFVNEPIGRNTAPAIGFAAIYLNHVSPESIMIILPSDHAIPETERFLNDLRLAIQSAEKNYLVAFGIKPTSPQTGYGYIEAGEFVESGMEGLFKVERFVEKPDFETAKKYLSRGGYYWNSGMFVWKSSKILSEIEKHLLALYRGLKEIETLIFVEGNSIPQSSICNPQLNSLYANLESISIDYGIMERSQDVLMVPATFRWSDLGSWGALDEIIERDKDGNILKGNTIDIGSQNSIIYADERVIATIGLKDMVVVDTPDATLITPKERSQEVRKIVDVLRQSNREEHILHKTVERPWGSYTVLEKSEGYKIKRVVLKPGSKLSMQLHRRRSEHWVVVAGEAKVTRGNEMYIVRTNESTYIPPHTKHRLENIGESFLQIIEVQNGEYLEEDDIERFDDIYGRK
jgi:mannose-1-phosphate guanylyltransferase/mannose-6-phosphate isomerase